MKKMYILYDARALSNEDEASILEVSEGKPDFCEWPDDSVCFVYDINKKNELVNGAFFKTFGELGKK